MWSESLKIQEGTFTQGFTQGLMGSGAPIFAPIVTQGEKHTVVKYHEHYNRHSAWSLCCDTLCVFPAAADIPVIYAYLSLKWLLRNMQQTCQACLRSTFFSLLTDSVTEMHDIWAANTSALELLWNVIVSDNRTKKKKSYSILGGVISKNMKQKIFVGPSKPTLF